MDYHLSLTHCIFISLEASNNWDYVLGKEIHNHKHLRENLMADFINKKKIICIFLLWYLLAIGMNFVMLFLVFYCYHTFNSHEVTNVPLYTRCCISLKWIMTMLVTWLSSSFLTLQSDLQLHSSAFVSDYTSISLFSSPYK